MQRYEREIEEILRGLEAQEDSIRNRDPQSKQSKPSPSKKVAVEPWLPYDGALAPRPTRSIARKSLWCACILLASALILLPFVAVLSAGLIGLSLMVLLVVLKRNSVIDEMGGDLAREDLRWDDVTVQVRPVTPGKPATPRKPDDSTFWSK